VKEHLFVVLLWINRSASGLCYCSGLSSYILYYLITCYLSSRSFMRTMISLFPRVVMQALMSSLMYTNAAKLKIYSLQITSLLCIELYFISAYKFPAVFINLSRQVAVP